MWSSPPPSPHTVQPGLRCCFNQQRGAVSTSLLLGCFHPSWLIDSLFHSPPGSHLSLEFNLPFPEVSLNSFSDESSPKSCGLWLQMKTSNRNFELKRKFPLNPLCQFSMRNSIGTPVVISLDWHRSLHYHPCRIPVFCMFQHSTDFHPSSHHSGGSSNSFPNLSHFHALCLFDLSNGVSSWACSKSLRQQQLLWIPKTTSSNPLFFWPSHLSEVNSFCCLNSLGVHVSPCKAQHTVGL